MCTHIRTTRVTSAGNRPLTALDKSMGLDTSQHTGRLSPASAFCPTYGEATLNLSSHVMATAVTWYKPRTYELGTGNDVDLPEGYSDQNSSFMSANTTARAVTYIPSQEGLVNTHYPIPKR
jgi:hypothetical protein